MRYSRFLVVGMLGLLGAMYSPAGAQDQVQRTIPLKVMSFNLRYASPKPPNSWPQRRPVTSETLRLTMPDIVGTQEGVYRQLLDIAADRPEYQWIGTGRDGGSRGEFMAVFYRKDRFEPIEFDHFWLSDTPQVIGSSTWGNTNIRMVTWVKFRDLQTEQEFYFVNTHLDHQVQVAREKGAELIVQKLNALNTTLPIILVGDFNAVARQNKSYDILTQGGFTDTWFAAKERRGKDVATFHGYNKPVDNGAHIDWILTRGNVTTDNTEIVTYSRDGQYPSDHFPIMATLQLSKPQ